MAHEIERMSRNELQELRAEVDRAISSLDERRRAEARAAAEKAARDYGYSLEDVVTTSTKRKTKSAPKYRNPEDPRKTWTGRGRQPAWIKDALAEGKSLDELVI